MPLEPVGRQLKLLQTVRVVSAPRRLPSMVEFREECFEIG